MAGSKWQSGFNVFQKLAIFLIAPLIAPSFAATGDFQAVGSMNIRRGGHTATLLPDGKVLVTGGDNTANAAPFLNSAELYDPASMTFYLTGAMSIGRGGHTATLLPNGKVLVVGGLDRWGTNHTLASAELYDPASGQFAPTAGSLITKRNFHTATLLNTGKVLIAGGAYTDTPGYWTYIPSAELYDPDTGTFSATGNLNTPRFWNSATLLDSGKVLIAGGNSYDTVQTSSELYDPTTGTFAYSGSFATPRLTTTAGLALPNNTVLFPAGANFDGGATILNSVERYDVATGHMNSAGMLITPRNNATSNLLPNGKVLIAAGFDGSVFLNSAELYDPVSDTSVMTSSVMTTRRYVHTSTTLRDGNVLLIGGYYVSGEATATAELYIATPLDNTPPKITPVISGTQGAAGWYTSTVTISWIVTDGESAITSAPCAPTTIATDTSGTTVSCTATSAGGTTSESVTIKVDRTPPTLTCSASPSVIWPPNNKLIDVAVSVGLSDTGSGADQFTLTSVTSNEPDSALNSPRGDRQGWTIGSADVSGTLRATRLGSGTGRMYTLVYTGQDTAGNSVDCTITVSVPH
jgi:hypothetical protein